MTNTHHGATPSSPANVTIVILGYNHENYIEQALRSATSQSHPRCRLLVFDDASSDGTADVARSFLDTCEMPADVVQHPINLGLCATLNEALGRVDTEFVTFVSADDWMEPDHVATLIGLLEERGDGCVVAYGDANRVDVAGNPLEPPFIEHWRGNPPPPDEDTYIEMLRRNWIPAPSVLIRTSALHEVGGYDESLAFEDYDMWLRLARRFSFAHVPKPLTNVREVPGSLSDRLSDDRSAMRREHILMLQKHLGASPEADLIIVDQIAELARSLYLHDSSADVVRESFDLVASRRRSPRWRAFQVLARLRVPGRYITQARSFAGRS